MLGSLFSFEYWGYFILVLSSVMALVQLSRSTDTVLYGTETRVIGWFLTILTILYIGLRPLELYGDSYLYSTIFRLVQTGIWETLPKISSESLWAEIEEFFIKNSTNQMWYLFVAAVYVGGIAFMCRKVFPYHYTLAFIFSITAMSFFTYGTNGLRQGFATSMALVAIPLIKSPGRTEENEATPLREIILGWAIMSSSIYIHRSNIALIFGIIAAYVLKNTRLNCIIWLCSIGLGLILKDAVLNVLGELSGDFRLSYYGNLEDASYYGEARFRWDFILYSAVPIALGWWFLVKEKFEDRFYAWLLNIYILVNAGWVVINNIAFSNRIAYISWILYPILLLYPFVKFDFSDHQGKFIAMLLVGYTLFAYVML